MEHDATWQQENGVTSNLHNAWGVDPDRLSSVKFRPWNHWDSWYENLTVAARCRFG